VFFLGIFTRRVGQRAAFAGLLAGLLVITAVAFGSSLAWPWYTMVGSIATFAFGLAASFVWPESHR
jgi:SSS family solute:Na+ symporter